MINMHIPWSILLILQFLLVWAESYRDTKTSVYRLIPNTRYQLQFLEEISLYPQYQLWKEPTTVFSPVDIMVEAQDKKYFFDKIDGANIRHEVLIDDVQALIDQVHYRHSFPSNEDSQIYPQIGGNTDSRSRNIQLDWNRYHNLEEIYGWLHNLERRFPGRASVAIGGFTSQQRLILGIHLTSDKKKPIIFIEGGIHAREWISPATATYMINELLTSNDPWVRQLADMYDWYIFPVVNPDGYAYSHSNPRSMHHRLWRKNRSGCQSVSEKTCCGVDLNRNFLWGEQRTDNKKFYPCEVYPGPHGFSEIESLSLSNFLRNISHDLAAYISFHSYSQILMYPYGFTSHSMDNKHQHSHIASEALRWLNKKYCTNYKHGSISEMFGCIRGTTLDYVKEVLCVPLVFIYELRDTGKFGFLLPPNQIIPNAQEVINSLIGLFYEARKIGYYWKQ